jgi:hypothetical protein
MAAEYMPIDAYAWLRRLAVHGGKQKLNVKGPDDSAAIGFLVTRGFATKSEDGAELHITEAGEKFGRVMSKAP